MNYVNEMTKMFEALRYQYEISHLFEDFLELIAITISNSVDRAQYDKRESRYMQIIGKYTHEEANTFFPKLFALLIKALEDEPDDYLGRLFMELELYNSWKGQFFTPIEVAVTMARMTIDAKLDDLLAEKGYIAAYEPTTGAGVTLIALYNEIKKRGYNPQQAMRITAQDIDIKAVHMTYIQLSLLGVNIQVIHGDTLTLENRSLWRSPGYFLFAGRGWGIRKVAEQDKALEIEPQAEFLLIQKPRVEQLTLF